MAMSESELTKNIRQFWTMHQCVSHRPLACNDGTYLRSRKLPRLRCLHGYVGHLNDENNLANMEVMLRLINQTTNIHALLPNIIRHHRRRTTQLSC